MSVLQRSTQGSWGTVWRKVSVVTLVLGWIALCFIFEPIRLSSLTVVGIVFGIALLAGHWGVGITHGGIGLFPLTIVVGIGLMVRSKAPRAPYQPQRINTEKVYPKAHRVSPKPQRAKKKGE